MPTINPVPSTDPTDLLFNAGKLDEVVNGAANSFTDRLGVERRTVAGMNADFDAQLADAESDLNVYRADAASSAAEALGYLQTIRATSYGAYAEDPATDPLGNPPTVGDEYFNTTANLLKRWNGATWQASDISTANLAAPSGSSLVGYMPAGTGAVATNLQDHLRRRVDIASYIPAAVVTETADCSPYVKLAIDAVPVGGILECSLTGTILLDIATTNFITSGTGKTYFAVRIDKPMTFIGNKNCKFKIKNFSTAWQTMVSGDALTAFLVTSSNVFVDGVKVDANGNNHYEMSGAYKYWETGPTLKRPIDGITISALMDLPNVENVIVENCDVTDALAGIAFRGNINGDVAGFLAKTKTTGVLKNCIARKNKISYCRGNGILFVSGVDSCHTYDNEFLNVMYHPVRYYYAAIDCTSNRDRSIVNCSEIIARYNATDNGYWRTDDALVPAFKIQRSSFMTGSLYHVVAGTHNVKNIVFDDCFGRFKQLQANQNSYFEMQEFYMAGVTLYAPNAVTVKNCDMDGFVYGANADGGDIDAVTSAIFFGNKLSSPVNYDTVLKKLDYVDFKSNITGGCNFELLSGGLISDNTFNQSSIDFKTSTDVTFENNTIRYDGKANFAGSSYLLLQDIKNCTIGKNALISPAGSTKYGVYVRGDCTGTTFKSADYNKAFPIDYRSFLHATAIPFVTVPYLSRSIPADTLVVDGGVFLNGWAAAEVGPAAGRESTLVTNSDGTVTLNLRVTAAAATATTVLKLTPALCPLKLISMTWNDLTTGAAFHGRILSGGEVQFTVQPGAGNTRLFTEVRYMPQ